jgi:hypothetical protein
MTVLIESPAAANALIQDGYSDELSGMVLDADAISVLPGWWRSNGASLEVYVAHKTGIPTWCATHGPDIDRNSLACNDCRHLLLPDLG